MLAISGPDKLLQGTLKLSSALQPGAMDPVARAINVAAPDALETEQGIAVKLRPDLLQLIVKSNNRFCAQAPDQSKRPLVLRPVIRGDKLDLVCRLLLEKKKKLQVPFGTAGW